MTTAKAGRRATRETRRDPIPRASDVAGTPREDRRASPSQGLRRTLLAPLILLTAACGASSAKWTTSWKDPYARFDGEAREEFAEARALLDGGRRVDAMDALRTLADAHPDNLEIACWLQDVEADLLHDGVEVFGPAKGARTFEPDEALRRAYAARMDEEPTVGAFLLAARSETDVLAAESLLRKALELDPVCAWAHYGLSHVLLEKRTQTDRWGLARESLERALELDPGHLRARRLEAWMMAEQGSRDVAERLLRRWIDQADGDPRVDEAEIVEAKLDLSLLMLLRGENGRAERVLDDLEGQEVGRARRWMLLTVARQESGDVLGALDATLRAQGAAGGTVLPVVQEALLHELFLDRPELAQARWEEVATLVDDAGTIRDLVQGLRARVRMEREAARRTDVAESR